MSEDLLETDSLLSVDTETRADEVLTLRTHVPPEDDLSVADLLVSLVGDVAADHVVEEDAQGPDSHGLGVVTPLSDPFGGRIHPGPVKVCKLLLLNKGSATEVDQTKSSGLEVDQNVLVLDVPVGDAESVALDHGVDDGSEELPGHLLSQGAHVGDVVK